VELNKIYHGNNLDILKTFDDNSIDSIVTDPPYGLGKEPNALEVLQSWITTGYHEIKGKGFMGKEWDSFVPQPIFWKECLRVLKPGGHLLSFAGTRTYDWVVMGLRIAGFEIRDQIAWLYGSGFPKSLDISKAIDKRKATSDEKSLEFAQYIKNKRNELDITLTEADHIICNGSTNYSWFEGRKTGQRLPSKNDYLKIKHLLNLSDEYDDIIGESEREVIGEYKTDMGGLGGERLGKKGGNITAPSTDQAKQWQGWGTALKPALEPIVMARKPLDGTVANNVLKHGVGGINIDGCRVETDEDLSVNYNSIRKSDDVMGERGYKMGFRQGKDSIAHATESTKLGRFPANVIHDGSDEVVSLFPDTNSGGSITKTYEDNSPLYGDYNVKTPFESYGDNGSASRFFYTAKASQTERNWGLNGFDEKYTASAEFRPNHMEKAINGENGNPYGRWQPKKNIHPTVKPIDLMRYLVRLVTPKNGICLDPYMGSGTTAVACKSEKINYIGCELDEDYIKIAEARIKAEVVMYDIFDFLD